jgi:hypothetical protein
MTLKGKVNIVFTFVFVSYKFNLLRFTALQYPGNARGGIEIIYKYVNLIARKINLNTI